MAHPQFRIRKIRSGKNRPAKFTLLFVGLPVIFVLVLTLQWVKAAPAVSPGLPSDSNVSKLPSTPTVDVTSGNLPTQSPPGGNIFPQLSGLNVQGIIVNQSASDTSAKNNPVTIYDNLTVSGLTDVQGGVMNNAPGVVSSPLKTPLQIFDDVQILGNPGSEPASAEAGRLDVRGGIFNREIGGSGLPVAIDDILKVLNYIDATNGIRNTSQVLEIATNTMKHIPLEIFDSLLVRGNASEAGNILVGKSITTGVNDQTGTSIFQDEKVQILRNLDVGGNLNVLGAIKAQKIGDFYAISAVNDKDVIDASGNPIAGVKSVSPACYSSGDIMVSCGGNIDQDGIKTDFLGTTSSEPIKEGEALFLGTDFVGGKCTAKMFDYYAKTGGITSSTKKFTLRSQIICFKSTY